MPKQKKMQKINTCNLLLVFVTSEFVLSYANQSSQKQICEKVSPLLLGPLMVLQTEDVPKVHPGTNEFKEWYGPNDDNGGTYVEKGGSSIRTQSEQNCSMAHLRVIPPTTATRAVTALL